MKLLHLDWQASHGLSGDSHWEITGPVRRTDIEDKRPVEAGHALFDAVKTALEADCYQHVADVEGKTMEYAFRYTQHIDDAWNEAPAEGVHPVGAGPFRSTSVGDIIDNDGRVFIVASYGFTELSSDILAEAFKPA